VELRLDETVSLVNLDDPSQLASRQLRPSQVATLRRAVSQRMSASTFDEGAAGLLWWSTLDAEWTNATLFHSGARKGSGAMDRKAPDKSVGHLTVAPRS
jgi:hypothetical protein